MKINTIRLFGLLAAVFALVFSNNALACASCIETGTTGVHAEKYDQLMGWYLLIGGIVSLLVYAWFTWLLYKFRASEGSQDPEDAPKLGKIPKHRGDPKWTWFVTVAIFAILMGLTAGTINMVEFYENPEEGWGDGPLTVQVTAHRYYWEFEYPNGNKTYDNLIVPINTIVILEVKTDDVWHNFAVPVSLDITKLDFFIKLASSIKLSDFSSLVIIIALIFFDSFISLGPGAITISKLL